MSEHDKDLHARLLEQVLAGEKAPDAPEVAAQRASSPAFARELDELLELKSLLEQDSADEREALSELSGDGTPTASRPAPAGPTEAHPVGNGPVGKLARWLVPLAAAAALLAWFALRGGAPGGDGNGEGPVQIPMGPGEVVRAVAPVGAVQSFAVFRVEAKLASSDTCKIRIWPADAAALDEPQVTETFHGLEWTPPAEILAALPDEILWSVTILGFDGEERGATAEVSASR